MQLMTILGFAFAIVAVLFALQNAAAVSVDFFFWHFSSSLALVLLITAMFGAFAMGLISTPAALRSQWRNSRQQKRIAELEKQLADKDKTIADLLQQVPKIDPAPGGDKPYVGLRKLMGGATEPADLPPPV
jgi:uncharacterized integral membrane protein